MDTANPYHYRRLQSITAGENSPLAADLLIVDGEDRKIGQADDAESRYMRLEAWARARFPMISEIKFRWSGQVMEPINDLAYIGLKPNG